MSTTEQDTPVEEFPAEDHRRWVYASGALLALIVAIVAGAVFLPGLTTKVVPGLAVANERDIAAAAADRKAADEAAAAKKAADDAQAFLVAAEANVKDSMQDYFNDPTNGVSTYDLTVYDVELISVGNNKFEGDAEMSALGGTHKQIIVHVIADDKNTQWLIDKGALLPLIQ